MTETTIIDWARGDRFRIDLPAHAEALLAGGPDFLTRAFRASGALAQDNAVTQITHCEEWQVGGTGAKAMLSVTYARDEPGLSGQLFVKFSRNFTDKTRDRVRFHMEPEVKLANLSRDPAFPIAVPKCVYADFHHASGTGIIITERIPFGEGAVEPHFPKATDHMLPDPLPHYRVLIATLGHLSGTHKSGRLGPSVERDFPFDLEKTVVSKRNHYDEPQLADRARRLTDFITKYPHLVPPHLADPDFLARFAKDAPLLIAQQDAITRHLFARPEMVALCHWNANIDNAWFWREPDGTLQCGLIDWGSVGQMNISQTIWGSLSCSEPELIDQHLDEMIDLFMVEFARAGGPVLDRAVVEEHLELHVMMSGLASMMIAPRAIMHEVPDPSVATDRFDPIFSVNETARVQLTAMTNSLNLWHRRDLGRLLRSGMFSKD